MPYTYEDVIPYGEKDTSGCGLIGFIHRDGRKEDGNNIIKAIEHMRERGNGLGGGFAVYGLYESYKDHYALHMMYDNDDARKNTEVFIKSSFAIDLEEQIPTRPNKLIKNPPLFYRYFCKIPETYLQFQEPDDYVREKVIFINKHIDGAFVLSSGKNMGAFKGVGEAHDIGDFFRLDEYKAHTWIAHSRFPTNTPGWWGGAHPFTMLNYSVVHNGEISSYGINRRYLESFGYECSMRTDTEVVAYGVDLLRRRHKLPWKAVAAVFASRFWKDIDKLSPEERDLHTRLRASYGGLLFNGPFAFIIGFEGGFMAIADRGKLRPMVVGYKGDSVYVSSEESAIRLIEPSLDRVWHPRAGEPVFAFLKGYEE
jgi:glutamate synthase domain-containing protein 1